VCIVLWNTNFSLQYLICPLHCNCYNFFSNVLLQFDDRHMETDIQLALEVCQRRQSQADKSWDGAGHWISTFHEITLLQNIQWVLWNVTLCPTLLMLQVLELKATQSQIWCLLQWCDVSVSVMPSSCQRTPGHTMQTVFYYAEVIGRNFLMPHNESCIDWCSQEMKVDFVLRRQMINSIWYKISRDHLDKHFQLCMMQLPNYWTAIILKKYIFYF